MISLMLMVIAQIRDLRVSLGLAQTEFGQLFGVHSMTVSRWERGELTPNAFQRALMTEFGKAAKRKNVADEVRTLLVSSGVIAAIFFLLCLARK